METAVNIAETEPVRHARKLLLRLVDAINRAAAVVVRLVAEIKQFHEDLRQLALQHPEYANPNQRDAAAFLTYSIMLFCASSSTQP